MIRRWPPLVPWTLLIRYSAIISLYQRLALPPSGLGEIHGPWYFAIQRCLSACDNMSMVVRATSDADLENISPYMIFCIFVGARFYLGWSHFPTLAAIED
jgi:hypothetical protein